MFPYIYIFEFFEFFEVIILLAFVKFWIDIFVRRLELQ